MDKYNEQRKKDLAELPKEQLIGMLEDAAKNWLAHDGLWFLAVEADHGMEEAIKHDTTAWKRFTKIEARRIMLSHMGPAMLAKSGAIAAASGGRIIAAEDGLVVDL